MSLAQMRAVLGKRIRPNEVAGINAQLPYLASLRAREDDRAYRGKMYGLEKKHYGLAEDRLGELKQQGQTAKKLGYAQLGIGGGLGLMRAMNQPDFDTLDPVTPTLSGVTEGYTEGFTGSLEPDMLSDFKGTAGAEEGIWDQVGEYVPDFFKNIYDDVLSPFLGSIGSLFD